METFAERVKLRRKAMGYTQDQLGQRSGLKQSDISKIEQGSIQETTKLLELAKALECTPEWLRYGKPHHYGPSPPALVLQAAEASTAGASLWPFKKLKPHEWERLTDGQKDLVEQNAREFSNLSAGSDASKHSVPAKNSGA
jgi:transcriptional regulator with XRE-family HTH domain